MKITALTVDYIIGNSGLEYPILPNMITNGKLQGGQYYIDYLSGGIIEGAGTDYLFYSPFFIITKNNIYYEGGFNKLLDNNLAIPTDITTYGAIRPSNPPIGFMFFDSSSSLNKPIWYNGSAWVDANGAIV